MGQDKATLAWNNRTLVEHALDKLRALDDQPRIVGSRPDLTAIAPVIHDDHSQAGPLAGIAAALSNTNAEQNIFLAVDLPFMPPDFLRRLAERAAKTNALATVPRHCGRSQPLCAIYSKALLPHAQAALRNGDARIIRAVARAEEANGLRADSFDVESLAAAQTWTYALPVHLWFLNLNTPADFLHAALEQSQSIH